VKVAIRPYELALRAPLVTARSEIGSRAGLLVSLRDGTLTGWGEAAPMPGWSDHDLDAVGAALASVIGNRRVPAGRGRSSPHAQATALSRESARDESGLSGPLAAEPAEAQPAGAELTEAELAGDDIDAALQRLRSVPEARAALAGAWADLQARQAGLPLALWLARSSGDEAALVADGWQHNEPRLSGRAGIGSVAVSEVIVDTDPEAAGEAARLAVAKGVRCLKVKVAAAAHEVDRARVAAVRDAAGSGIELRLDANGGWPPDRAAELLDSFAGFGIAFCEEPTAGIEAIAAVGASARIPVAVDESARTLEDISAALGSEAVAAVVVKPQALGGADLAMQAVSLARRHGALPVISTMIDSAVGVAHAVHLAAAADAARGVQAGTAHGLGTSALLASDVADPLPVVDGRIAVPAGPGLGTVPNRVPR